MLHPPSCSESSLPPTNVRGSCGHTEPFVIIRAISTMSLRSGVGVGLSFKLPQDSLPGLLSGLPLGSSLRSMAGAPTKPQFWVTTWFISLSLLTLRLLTFWIILHQDNIFLSYSMIQIHNLDSDCVTTSASIQNSSFHSFTQHKLMSKIFSFFFSLCRGDVELNLTPSLILLGWREIQSQLLWGLHPPPKGCTICPENRRRSLAQTCGRTCCSSPKSPSKSSTSTVCRL